MMLGDRLQRILVWLLIGAVGVFLLERLFGLMARFATPLLLFGLAWLIALILQPLITRMTQLTLPVPLVSHRSPDSGLISPTWRLPRGLAVLLVYLALIAILVFLVVSLVPVLGPQLLSLQTTLPDAVTTIPTWAAGLETQFNRLGFHMNLEQVVQPEALAQQAAALGSTVIQQSLGIVSGIAVLLINVVLILILSFYMTLDGPRLAARLLDVLPASWHDDTLTFFTIVNRTFGGFLRAQLVQALLYGIVTAILMIMLNLSDVALASVLAAILVLIPLIGGLFAMIPPLLIVLIEAPDRFLILLIGLIILQQVLFNIVMPRLMGRIVGLHPLLVFAAILMGAALAGGWGILFGIPIAGVIASVMHFIYVRATAGRTAVVASLPADDGQALS
jgi:predicted PurR-regulated permease PerM